MGPRSFGHEKVAYIAGPMRDIDQWNFPAFYSAEDDLRHKGWKVYNPASHDEEDTGLNRADYPNLPDGFVENAMRWDLSVIAKDAECVILLPGWQNSSGVKQEIQVARWCNRPIYEYESHGGLTMLHPLPDNTEDNYIRHMDTVVGQVGGPTGPQGEIGSQDFHKSAQELIDDTARAFQAYIGGVPVSVDPVARGIIVESMRQFDSGATRNSDSGKLDYEGFLSPAVLRRYAEYLNKHRYLEDGTLRDSDNWQQGIPKVVYMKSMWRHFHDVWSQHRGLPEDDYSLQESLCAVIFNASGYLFELLKEERNG